MMEGVLFLPPATKLGQGYIFTGVCDSVNRGCLVLGGVPGLGGVCAWSQGVSGPGRRVCLVPGGLVQGVSGPGGCLLPAGGLVETPPGTATAAGGTHPTGMHSCSWWKYSQYLFEGIFKYNRLQVRHHGNSHYLVVMVIYRLIAQKKMNLKGFITNTKECKLPSFILIRTFHVVM